MFEGVTQMATKSSRLKRFIPPVFVSVLTETSTGEPYGVNWSHVESVSVHEAGTLIAFASGDTVTVRESFGDVMGTLRQV